jgi:hypothetical protein
VEVAKAALGTASESKAPRRAHESPCGVWAREHIAKENPVVNSQRCLMLALVLSLTACKGESPASSSSRAASAMAADQVASPASGDSGRCPLRAADLDKLTPYRWKFAQYQADRRYIPSGGSVRIDFCELIGMDEKGSARAGVMVNIARGANAEAFAKHWHAACAGSLMPEARGKVQPIPGVPGGQQCVTAKGSSSSYWIELSGRTIQIEPLTESAEWEKIFPQLLAAAAQ